MGRIRTNIMHGEIYYRSGGNFFFFAAKALHRTVMGRPRLFAGLAMIHGYLWAILRRRKPLVSAVEARCYRRLLNRRIRGGWRRLLPIHP
jgi:hypothetical protein